MRRFHFLALALLLATGCGGWVRLGEGLPPEPEGYRQFQVWSRGESTTLYSLRIQGDTLLGIPANQSRDCEPCRIRMPRAEVDSVRVVADGRAGSFIFGTVAAIPLGMFALFYLMYGPRI